MKKFFLGLSAFLASVSIASSVVSLGGGGGGGGGISQINTETGSTQTLAVGTSGTDFAVSSSSDTHTFNLPNASATARGVVSTGTQTFAGAKTFSSAITASLTGNASTATALAANPTDCGVGDFATAIDASGNLTCATPSAGVTGSGAANRVAYWTGAGALSSTANFGWDGTTFSPLLDLRLNGASTSAATGVIRNSVADGATCFSGGSACSSGSTYALAYGPSHATLAGNWRVFNTSNHLVEAYDNAGDTWAWKTGNTTRLSISSAGLVGVPNLQLNRSATSATTAVISNSVSDGAVCVSGDSSGTTGFNACSYAGSHATKANNYELRAATTTKLSYDGTNWILPASTHFYCATDGGCNLGKDNNVAGTGSQRFNVIASGVTTSNVVFGENSSTVASQLRKSATNAITFRTGSTDWLILTGDASPIRVNGAITYSGQSGAANSEQGAIIPINSIVTTSDNTVTNVHTIALGAFTNFSFMYENICVARNTTASVGTPAKFRKDFVVTNISGTVTLVDSSAVGTDYNPDSLGGISASMSGNTLQFQVQGKGSTTVKWNCTITKLGVS